MKKYVPYILTFIVGLILGTVIVIRSSNKRIQKRSAEAQRIEQVMKDSIHAIEKRNAVLEYDNKLLDDKIYQDSVNYALERTKTIPKHRTVQQESNILTKGKELYGSSPATNSRRALIASYGNQGLDEVDVLRRKTANQKALLINCKEIVQYKDTIIVEYKEGLKFAAKKSKKGQLGKGIGLGVVGTILVLLVL